MDDKKPTDLTIPELEEKIPGMSDDDLRAAWIAETTTEGHTERAGATAAIKAEAEKRGELEGITRPVETAPTEKAKKAAPKKGGKKAKGDDKPKREETAAEREARLQKASDDAIMAEMEADPRKALLRIHRSLEAIAGHINIQLPR